MTAWQCIEGHGYQERGYVSLEIMEDMRAFLTHLDESWPVRSLDETAWTTAISAQIVQRGVVGAGPMVEGLRLRHVTTEEEPSQRAPVCRVVGRRMRG